MTRLLLIDGDELLHRNLIALEREIDWGGQQWTLHTNQEEARSVITGKVADLQSLFAPRTTVCAFSSPDNFRKGVWGKYKANRYGSRKPLGFATLRAEIMDGSLPNCRGVVHGGLEADDVLGILATKPGNESHVLVSVDKDFNTVPCVRFSGTPTVYGNGKLVPEVEVVPEDDADRFHMVQTLMGDTSDGYPGCPGIGAETAAEMLDGQLKWVPYEHQFQKGKRKGETETRWEKAPGASSPWETVTSCYARAGLTEDDALAQARLARILRWEDWDHANKEIRLWTPTARTARTAPRSGSATSG